MEATDDFQLVGVLLEGRFRVERVVAHGGFGVVYSAKHVTLDRPIAIKVLKIPPDVAESPKAVAQVKEAFAKEAKVIASLRHPHIVQAIDQGVSMMPTGESAPWMALEWLRGKDFRTWLREQNAPAYSPPEALALLHSIFDALEEAHRMEPNPIAHRDVKPANIMVVERGRQRSLLLVDFGIAKVMEEGERAGKGATRTKSDRLSYTPLYAAPEQAMGGRTGPWTDVHALALILVELLVGRPAYLSDSAVGLRAENCSRERPTPAAHGVNVGSWEPVLARALHFDHFERYPSAGEFLAALENSMPSALAGGTAAAQQPSAFVPLTQAQRNGPAVRLSPPVTSPSVAAMIDRERQTAPVRPSQVAPTLVDTTPGRVAAPPVVAIPPTRVQDQALPVLATPVTPVMGRPWAAIIAGGALVLLGIGAAVGGIYAKSHRAVPVTQPSAPSAAPQAAPVQPPPAPVVAPAPAASTILALPPAQLVPAADRPPPPLVISRDGHVQPQAVLAAPAVHVAPTRPTPRSNGRLSPASHNPFQLN